MSDEEEVYEEEEGGEEEDEEPVEEEAPVEKPKSRPPPPPAAEEGETMTEAEKAMAAAKKKHEEEQANRLKEYEAARSEELQRLDDELRELKERQQRRREERAEQEREMAEAKRREEDLRKHEEEERKRKIEEAKRAREQEKLKKMAAAAGRFGGGADSQMSILQAQSEAKLTPEERAKQKADFLAIKLKPLNLSGLDPHTLKERVKDLHKRLAQLEGAKYDLENRTTTQDYDLKEMKERANQKARADALKKGVEPTEAVSAKHPPKKQVASKFDRQIDRRGYGERRDMYESPAPEELPEIFHGSARPPNEWGRTAIKNEELEQLRKGLEPPKYKEVVPGANEPVSQSEEDD